MAAGLMVVFVLAQMVLGLVVLTWLWIVISHSLQRGLNGTRGRMLLFAVMALTLGVAVDFYFMFSRNSLGAHAKLPEFTSFALACLAVVFALFGKGKGRIITAVASCGLAASWLPFILP